MAASSPAVLDAAIGTYPATEALIGGRVRSDAVSFRFAELSTANRAFAPMVRELRYDISEMAIATFLQARDAGVPIVLLPVVLAARFQESALLSLRDGPVRGPEDLRGRVVAARSYSQTTAMWLRGILADRYNIRADEMSWLCFEDAHVAGIEDPSFVRRAAPGQSLLGALRSGEADAVIVGNEVPDDADLRTVFADPDAAAEAFLHRHGGVPINHVLTMRADLAREHPDLAEEVVALFRASAAEAGHDRVSPLLLDRAAIEAGVTLAARFTAEQGMLRRPLDAAAIWAGTPDRVWNAVRDGVLEPAGIGR